MKRFSRIGSSIYQFFATLSLKDKCLIIFMGILLAQTIYNIFAHEMMSNSLETIDIIIRTSSSGILGYFLSSSFCERDPNATKKMASKNGEEPFIPSPESKARDQMIIATIIGIIALLVLLIARNFMAPTVNSQASLIQMRDFASSTIGFLLGNSGKDKKS